MKKQRICILVIIAFSLIACLPHEENKVVCILEENKSDVYLSAYYSEKEVTNIEMQFSQKFSEGSVKGLGQNNVVEELESIFKQSDNPDVELDVQYDKKTRVAKVVISIPYDKMKEVDLVSLNLDKKNNVNNFTEALTSKGYHCGEEI